MRAEFNLLLTSWYLGGQLFGSAFRLVWRRYGKSITKFGCLEHLKAQNDGDVNFWGYIVPWIQHFSVENAALGHLILRAKIMHGDG